MPAADSAFPKAEQVPAEHLYDFDAGFLGIHHVTDTFLFWDTGKGVRIKNVARGSAASRGGLAKDDIITHFQGKRVTKSEELDRMIRGAAAGSVVVIELYRGAKRYQTVVQLSPPPDFDRLYRVTSLKIPFETPFIVDYEEYKAFDYKRLSFVWPLLQYEKSGGKTNVTIVCWPLTMQYEEP